MVEVAAGGLALVCSNRRRCVVALTGANVNVSNRTILLNVFGMLGVKASSMYVGFAIIPSLLRYFDGDQHIVGIWLSFVAILGVVASFDLGIGNRLKNDVLVRASTGQDYTDLVVGAIIAQLFIATALVSAGAALWVYGVAYSPLVPEFATPFVSSSRLTFIAAAFICCVMPLRMSYYILQAKQMNALSSLVVLVPQVALYAFVTTSYVSVPGDSLSDLAIVLFVSTVAANCIPLAFLLNIAAARKMSFGILDAENFFKRQLANIRGGFGFFVIQLSIVFVYGSNELFYLVLGSAQDVLHYQYYYRPFSLFSVGFSLLSLPFWSAIRASHLAGNVGRTRQLVLAILLLNVPVVLAVLPASIYFQSVLDLWLGNGVFVSSPRMLLLFSIFAVLICLMHALSSILSGYDLILFQAKVLASSLILKAFILLAGKAILSSFDPVMVATVGALLFIVLMFASKSRKVWSSIVTAG